MAKIIKTITGEAAFILEQTFESEEKVTEEAEPLTQEVKNVEIKINNTIEFLSRTDNISNRAISELGMQVSYPETLQIYVDK